MLLSIKGKDYGYKCQDNQHRVHGYYFSQRPRMKQFHGGENNNCKERGKEYQQHSHTSECCRGEGYAVVVPTNVALNPFVFLADFIDCIVGNGVQSVLQRFLACIGQSDRQDSFQKFKQVEHVFGKHTRLLDKVTQTVVSPANFRFEVMELVCQRVVTLFKTLAAQDFSAFVFILRNITLHHIIAVIEFFICHNSLPIV